MLSCLHCHVPLTGELRSSALACPCAFIESLSTLVRLLLVSDDDETMPMNGEQSDRRCWFCPFFMSTTDGDMTASCWSCPWCIVIIINLSWLLQSEYSSIYSYSAGWDCLWQACGPVGDSITLLLSLSSVQWSGMRCSSTRLQARSHLPCVCIWAPWHSCAPLLNPVRGRIGCVQLFHIPWHFSVFLHMFWLHGYFKWPNQTLLTKISLLFILFVKGPDKDAALNHQIHHHRHFLCLINSCSDSRSNNIIDPVR